MTDALVSVGIPAHDNASTIGETIDSLRQQTYRHWECFVSCDTESHATYEQARRSIGDDVRFTLSHNHVHPGVVGNWNEVLARASGPLFKLLCADDVLHVDALRVQLDAISSHPSASLCVGRREIINHRGRTIQRDRGLKDARSLLTLEDVITRMLRAGTNPLGEPSFALYRTDVLRSVGGFSSTWQYTIDLASYVAVLQRGDLALVDEVVGKFRVSPTSWSSSLGREQSREMLRFVDYSLAQSGVSVPRGQLVATKIRVVLTAALRRWVAQLSGRRAGRTSS